MREAAPRWVLALVGLTTVSITLFWWWLVYKFFVWLVC